MCRRTIACAFRLLFGIRVFHAVWTALCAYTLAAETAMVLAKLKSFKFSLTQKATCAVFENAVIFVGLPLQGSTTHSTATKLCDVSTF